MPATGWRAECVAMALYRFGSTPAEAAESIGVTFLMNGCPATIYGARAFAAFQEFYAERAAQPDRHHSAH